jgi:hypothetical protein
MESYFDHVLTISIILGIFIITFSKEIIKADNYLGIYARKQEKKLGTSVGLYLGLLLFIAMSIIGFHLTYKLIKDENETIEEFYNIDGSVFKYFTVISFPILFTIYIIISELILYIQNNGQYLKRKT